MHLAENLSCVGMRVGVCVSVHEVEEVIVPL